MHLLTDCCKFCNAYFIMQPVVLGCCDLRAQSGSWSCCTSDNWPWSINPACPGLSSPVQKIHLFNPFFFREPPSLSRNCTYTPVWGNCQNKHTLSPCSPGLEVYLNSQGETKGSWFRRYLFLRLVNGLVYYTRPAVCKLVLLRGKELRFWNESNSWWGLELHNLALCQSRWEYILFWYSWV